MKLRMCLAGAWLLLSGASFAMQQMPDKCPSVTAIRSVGIEKNLHQYGERGWFFDAKSKFDTNTVWRVGIGEMQASSYEEALWKVRVYLEQIAVLRDGPIEVTADDFTGWICDYEGYNKLIMTAFSPDFPGQSLLFLHKKIK